jgi:hypothetical protein
MVQFQSGREVLSPSSASCHSRGQISSWLRHGT